MSGEELNRLVALSDASRTNRRLESLAQRILNHPQLMALASGSRIGPYEVLAPLGAGGMGEVYRARDTRLNRVVAIKALPDLFAEDPERGARLEREAQVLASLNHP